MKTISSLILEADVLGVEASLYSRLGYKKNKNLFGGIISIIMAALIFGGTLFFAIEFFERKNFSLVSNFSNNPNLSFLNFNEVPFMIRISGDTGISFPADYYSVMMRTGSFDESVNSTHYTENVVIEPCDLNTHLSKFKALFKDIKDINTYYCPVWNRTFDIHGIYGSTNFTYANLFFGLCREKNCKSTNITKPALAASYFDFITVTNKINHDSIVPNEKILHKSRVLVSSTIYKRIWYYYEKIDYISDFGYIFEEKIKETFNNVKEYKVDVDIRNVDNSFFLWVTLSNYVDETKFTRGYMKAQALFANIGGIINGLIVCGMIVTFPIANNLASQDLINSIYDRSNLKITLDESNKQINHIKSNLNKINDFTNKDIEEIKQLSHRVKKKTSTNTNTNTNPIKSSNDVNHFKDISSVENIESEDIKNSTENNLVNHQTKAKNNMNILNSKLVKKYNNNTTNQKVVLKSKSILNRIISRNNFVGKYDDISDPFQEGSIKNNKMYILSKDPIKLGKLNLLDPFQCCLETNRKMFFKKHLEKAYQLLNISNLSIMLQEFNAVKSFILKDSQKDFIETLFSYNPDSYHLSKLFNKINLECSSDSINKKLISLFVCN